MISQGFVPPTATPARANRVLIICSGLATEFLPFFHGSMKEKELFE
jgi:hypothetical protein